MRLRARPTLSRVPDAVQRVTKWSGASLIRDRHGLKRSRVCSASLRYASCCAAPGTRVKRQPAAVRNRGRGNFIVSGCYLQWMAQLQRVERVRAVRRSASQGRWIRARSGVTAKLRTHADFAMVCVSQSGDNLPSRAHDADAGVQDEAMDSRGGRATSRRVSILGAMLALLALPGTAAAQNFPSRPLTLVVPFAAGGPSDVPGR